MLLILVLRVTLVPGLLVYHAVTGGHADLAAWLSAVLAPSEPGFITLIYRLFVFIVLLVLDIFLLVRFLQMKKGIGNILFRVLAIQTMFELGDATILSLFTSDEFKVASHSGPIFGLAVMQYLCVSPRAKATFTR